MAVCDVCAMESKMIKDLSDISDGKIYDSNDMARLACGNCGGCSIHDYRPGLCRTFPLGRIYGEKTVRYFMQKDGCKKQNRSKIKIEKWLDTPQNGAYEKYLAQWHDFRKRAGEYGKKAGEEETKALNMLIFGLLYQKPYEEEAFYQQFSGRLKQIPL